MQGPMAAAPLTVLRSEKRRLEAASKALGLLTAAPRVVAGSLGGWPQSPRVLELAEEEPLMPECWCYSAPT